MSRHQQNTSRAIYASRKISHHYPNGIEEAFRRIVERASRLEAENRRLEKEVAEHKQVARKLSKLALTDELTGLYNRRGFFQLAEPQLKLARRMRTGLALIYVDVDDLKHINDSYGHNEGSNALCAAAKILRSTFRDSDIVARVGGDEFIALVIPSSADSSTAITNRLQQQVFDHNAESASLYDLSLSAGIAYLDPKCCGSLEELMTKADDEMYKEKRRRRVSKITTRGCERASYSVDA